MLIIALVYRGDLADSQLLQESGQLPLAPPIADADYQFGLHRNFQQHRPSHLQSTHHPAVLQLDSIKTNHRLQSQRQISLPSDQSSQPIARHVVTPTNRPPGAPAHRSYAHNAAPTLGIIIIITTIISTAPPPSPAAPPVLVFRTAHLRPLHVPRRDRHSLRPRRR
jgi:hypothetical protein